MDVKSTTISTFHINCVKEHECKIERYNVVFFTTQFLKIKCWYTYLKTYSDALNTFYISAHC